MAATASTRISIRGDGRLNAPAARIGDLPGPRGLPLLGNVRDFERLGGMHRALERWADEFGPIYRLRLGTRDAVCVSDATLIAEALRMRPSVFSRGRAGEIVNETMPAGLFSAEGEVWERQRRLVMRALTPAQLERFFPILKTVTERLRAKWAAEAAAGTESNLARDLKCYAVDVATWLSTGADVDTLAHPENPLQSDVEFWFSLLGRRLAAPIPYWRWFKLSVDRQADRVFARIGALVATLIERTRERLRAEPALRERPTNIIEALVAARDEPGSEFTDDDVVGNVMTVLFAGEDTAANAMAWLLQLLVMHPEQLPPLVAEADEVLGGATVAASFDDAQRLPGLEAAIIESMRLKPVAPFIGVRAEQDVELAGLVVPRGCVLLLAGRKAAERSGAYPQGERFDPQRWLESRSGGASDPKRSMFPFGGGPRFCPGRYLAMLEITMVMSMVLRNFAPTAAPGADAVREKLTFTMAPNRLRMRLQPRTDAAAGRDGGA